MAQGLKLAPDWAAEFPELKGKDQLDVLTDLMPLDVGKWYAKVEETDKGRKLYGLIPLMASCSYGQIGALSFNERVLRCAGHVLTEGNTLLDDAELEMLVVLRMNRDFIEFMREHYGHLLKEQFGLVWQDGGQG